MEGGDRYISQTPRSCIFHLDDVCLGADNDIARNGIPQPSTKQGKVNFLVNLKGEGYHNRGSISIAWGGIITL